jgi:Flp pilus assembly protein TadB
MGFRDQLYERQGRFSLGVFGFLVIVLLDFAFECGLSMASRRAIRVFAAVFLAFSLVLLASGFTPVGALGVLGTLAFFACDFAMHRYGRIRIEKER